MKHEHRHNLNIPGVKPALTAQGGRTKILGVDRKHLRADPMKTILRIAAAALATLAAIWNAHKATRRFQDQWNAGCRKGCVDVRRCRNS